MYKISSGFKNRFICCMKNGELIIIDKYGILEFKKLKYLYRILYDLFKKGYNYSCLIL